MPVRGSWIEEFESKTGAVIAHLDFAIISITPDHSLRSYISLLDSCHLVSTLSAIELLACNALPLLA